MVPAVLLPCQGGPDEKEGQLIVVQPECAQVEGVEETKAFQAFIGPIDAEAFGIGDDASSPACAH